MSFLSRLALSKRTVTLLLASGLFVAGILAWGSLKQELLPDFEFPVVTVIAPYPGAGASDVSTQVTEPLERAVTGVARLERLQSTSANSVGLVVARFEFGVNVKDATNAIEENLAVAGLPDGVEPQVVALNINAVPVVIASVTATDPDGLETVAAIARREILPALQSIEGVASAELTGGLEDQVVVTLYPQALADAGISLAQVQGVLAANNITLPGGQVPDGGVEVPVSVIGRFESIGQLRGLVVGARASTAGAPAPVTLDDVGDVEQVAVATTGYGQTNGKPSVSLQVSKTASANTVEVAEAVQAELAAVEQRHADVLTVATVSDQSVFIVDSADGLLREGGLGAIFAVLTIFAFLFSVRSTFVAAVSIPLSVLTALVIMQLTGITINILTLGGLAVAVGRVVDDSIVVLENIYRHRALGDDRMTASLKGPREVASAITASTLTTVAVFLPLGFAGGFVSQFFLQFALTVTFALVASLIVALTVVPVLAYLILGRVSGSVDETGEPRNSLWVRAYDPTIRLALRNRWTKLGVVAIAAGLFVGSLALVPLLPTQFINSGSEKVLSVTLAPPSGASSEAVLEQAGRAEELLLGDPQVEVVQTTVPAEGATGFQAIFAAQLGRPANSATMIVRLKPDTDMAVYIDRLASLLQPVGTDGYSVAVTQQAGGTSNAIQVIVSGSDTADVAAATTAVQAAMADVPDLDNVSSDLVKAAPEIQVRVDPNRAAAIGSSAAQIGGEVRAALTGQTLGRVALGDADPVALFLQVDPEAVTSVEDLGDLPVGTITKAPLGTIADVEQVEVQGSITRIDARPSASINGEVGSDDTGAVSAAVQAAIDDLKAADELPAGVDVRLAGVTEQQNEAFGGLFTAMGVAIALVYLMMVLAFNSLVTPFIILFSLPLATIGAFPALVLTNRPIGVSGLIGFLMLIGIVVTNAIVLLDLVERLRADGHSTHDALVEGGKTRVRPILMTAIATILALVPLAAGFNEGSIIAAELGTVVIGGLLSSTFLTLMVVPVVYSLIDGVRTRLRGGRRRVEVTA